MLTIAGRHNGKQLFTRVALMPIESRDGVSSDMFSASEIQVLEGLIDTGATTTSISSETAQKLNLVPIGMHNVMTAGGMQYRPSYLLRVGLANIGQTSQTFLVPDNPINATEMPSHNFPFDVLIGMDIITQGILTVTSRRFEFTYKSTQDV